MKIPRSPCEITNVCRRFVSIKWTEDHRDVERPRQSIKKPLNDVPTWRWHHHVNLRPDRDVVLFSVTDLPTIRTLGLYREEGRTANGEVMNVAVQP